MSWAEIKKAVNSNLSVPLNHLIWANDYKTFGSRSYVYNTSSIWAELMNDWDLVIYDDDLINTGYNYALSQGTQESYLSACESAGRSVVTQSVSELTWAEIAAIAESGQAANTFAVGDTISITTTDEETIPLVIVDFDHDYLADGSGRAGITFASQNCIATKKAMNSTNINTTGFIESDLGKWLNGDFLTTLPTELQSVIKSVCKYTSAGGTSTDIWNEEAKIFLFSESEIFGSKLYSTGNEGDQYSYFTKASARKKTIGVDGSLYYWWERSPYATNSNYFCSVDTTGNKSYGNAVNLHGVCFGLSV